uniref:Lipoyl-binding domain-containing protein n=1 Tax=Physcomitrium patens TaxID=3218 RepID=A0A7I4CL00_PHYPA
MASIRLAAIWAHEGPPRSRHPQQIRRRMQICRWRKREGDEESAGDILCEIEVMSVLTDFGWTENVIGGRNLQIIVTCESLVCNQNKSTLEMEAMEDGFLGKNVVCKNTNNIPCGQVICLMIDTEDQLETIGDYKVAVEGSSAPSQQSAPAAVPSPTPAPHSTASKPSTALPHQPDGGFQVSMSSFKGIGLQGSVIY